MKPYKTHALRILAAVFALLAFVTVYANQYPEVYHMPFTSAPPTFDPNGSQAVVFDGVNYWYWWGGGYNNLGQYWDPGWYTENPVSINRDVVDVIESDPPPPQRPAWAIFDQEPDGTWYYSGGYWNGTYHSEGFYLASEIV